MRTSLLIDSFGLKVYLVTACDCIKNYQAHTHNTRKQIYTAQYLCLFKAQFETTSAYTMIYALNYELRNDNSAIAIVVYTSRYKQLYTHIRHHHVKYAWAKSVASIWLSCDPFCVRASFMWLQLAVAARGKLMSTVQSANMCHEFSFFSPRLV